MIRTRFAVVAATTTLAAVVLQSAHAQEASGIKRGFVLPAAAVAGPTLLPPGAAVPADSEVAAPTKGHLLKPGLLPIGKAGRPSLKPVPVSSKTVTPAHPTQHVRQVQSAAVVRMTPAHGVQVVPRPTSGALYPTPVPHVPHQMGGAYYTNQAFAPHEYLYAHDYKAMYGPYYYRAKGGWIVTPKGVWNHENWELLGTEVEVKYRSHRPWFNWFTPLSIPHTDFTDNDPW